MKKSIVVFASVLVCILPNLSFANLSGPFTTTTPIPSTLTDWTGTLSFPQFDPALGTLQSVQLNLYGSLSTILTVTNNGTTESSGTAKLELQMTVQDGGGNLMAPEIDMFSPEITYNLGAGESLISDPLTQSNTSSETYTALAVLTEFTGPGTITLPAGTFTQTWLVNTGGNTVVAQVTNAELTGDVVYTYTVPEPATIGLLGLGALSFIRRKR